VAGKPLEELAREFGILDAIKLASNENPFGPSPRSVEAAQRALLSAHRYPDAAQHAIRRRLAEHYGCTPEEVIVGAGSNELLDLLGRAFCVAGDHVVYGTPSFPIYRLVAQVNQLQTTEVELDPEYVNDLEATAAACRGNTRIVLLANPNNPTGTYVGGDRLLRFLDQVPEEVLVVLDEAYIEFVTAPDFLDGNALRQRRHNLIVLRTFSKAYGLAGLRVGYGLARPELVAVLDRVRAPFNVSGVAMAAAIAALDDGGFVQRVVEVNASERERVSYAMVGLGLTVYRSEANFVLVETPKSAQDLYQALLRRGVIVRPVGPGRVARCVRISIGTATENDRLLRALREVLAG
jgi:histidinol-phosphate aminotransferase